jgi:hypothetical protein
MASERIYFLSMPGGVAYYGPPLGIHRIYGFALAQGWAAELVDLRIEFWRYWLAANQIDKAIRRLQTNGQLLDPHFEAGTFRKRFVTTNIWGHGRLYPKTYLEPQRSVARFLMKHKPAELMARLRQWDSRDSQQISARLHDPAFWKFQCEDDEELFLWGSIIQSLNFFPTILKPDGVFLEASPFSSHQIEGALTDARTNPFVEFGEKFVVPLLEAGRATVVGMNVPHESGVIPALSIATLVKRSLPQIRTILGGMQVSLMAPDLTKVPKLLHSVDYIISSAAAEGQLKSLIEAKTPAEEERIPGLFLHREDKFVEIPGVALFDMNTVGLPSYPPQYRASYNSFNIMTSLHCYYKRCAFCTYTHSSHLTNKMALTPGGNWRDVNLIVDEIRQPFLWPEGSPSSFFYFEDSAMPPARLRAILEATKDAGLEIQSYAFLRFEHMLLSGRVDFDKLYKLGLRKVFMGLEAGNQRVNDLMDKGIQVRDARQIVRILHEAGIQVNLGTIVGYPTETMQEADDTLEFVVSNEKFLNHVEVNPMRLERTAPLFNKPQPFDLVTWQNPNEDLSFFYEYRVNIRDTIGSAESVPICNSFNRQLLAVHENDVDWDVVFTYQ